MRLKIIYLAFSILFLISNKINAQSQSTFTLKEAQEFGLENNHDIRNSKTDIEIAKKQVKETITIGLPQINASISSTNYIDIPTTLMPDFISPAVFAVNENYFGLTPTQNPGEMTFFPGRFWD